MKGNESASGSNLWPMPRFATFRSDKLLFLNSEKFTFESNLLDSCDIIKANIKLYKNILFPPRIYSSEKHKSIDEKDLLKKIVITVEQPCPGYPNSNMDESCMSQIELSYFFFYLDSNKN